MCHLPLVVVLVVVAAAPWPVVAAGRAERSDTAGSRAAASTRNPAAVLSDLQRWLGVMAGALETTGESSKGLAVALTAARGRTIAASAIHALAGGIGQALVGVDLDEEAVERLAQNLYAAMSSRDLTGREVGLLLVDTMTILGQAGAEPPAIERVTRLLMDTCPEAPDSVPAARQAVGPPLLTPR
jgi:hypothetical protein